jgi:cold shock CspA family protein
VIVLGHVEAFDDRRGDGLLRSDEGARFYFHCVAIADGSRQIDPGTRVRARRHTGLLGHDDVVAVEKLT